MEDLFSRIFEDLVGRVSGPMKFRLIFQPVMAAIFAIRSGLRDAKEEKPAYLWAMFTNPDSWVDMMRDGWKSLGRVFILAILLDAIYQFIVFRWFYPLEALLVAAILALIPYLLIRGPVNRIAKEVKR
jgi:hypothetical protein